MVTAKSTDRLSTASRTSALVVKIYAILSWRSMMSTQKKSPIILDCVTDTIVANLAAFPFPAPSSFATLTLYVT